MRQLFVVPLLLGLTGCGVTAGELAVTGAGVMAGQKMHEENIDLVPPKGKRTAEGYANQLRDNVKKTANKAQEWWFTPLPSTEPLPVQASYCYKAQTDTLCYRQPMPGWEHRLIAYQGTNASPPPAAVMQLLPAKNTDVGRLAESRVAGAQPVFVDLPPETKDLPKDNSLGESAHEALPDPSTSPQL